MYISFVLWKESLYWVDLGRVDYILNKLMLLSHAPGEVQYSVEYEYSTYNAKVDFSSTVVHNS